jgi:hypothetical protein
MITDPYLSALRGLFIQHGVVLAYLFGSRAEGRARPGSDIDLAVLLPPGTPRNKFFDARLSLTNELMGLFHKDRVDVVILNEAPPLLAHQVIKFGKIIYEDETTRPAIDFAVYTMSRYSDSAPARRLAQAALGAWIEERRAARALAEPREPFRWE